MYILQVYSTLHSRVIIIITVVVVVTMCCNINKSESLLRPLHVARVLLCPRTIIQVPLASELLQLASKDKSRSNGGYNML